MMETVSPAEKILPSPYPIRIRRLAPGAVRVTHGDPVTETFPPDRTWLKDVLLETREDISPPDFSVSVENGLLTARSPHGTVFFEEVLPARQRVKRLVGYAAAEIPALEFRLGLRRVRDGVRMAFRIAPGERFYGWGEWFNAFDRQEGRIRLQIRDSIALLQHRETYSGIPVFYSSRGYALFLLNSHRSDWNINTGKGVLEIDAEGPPADYILMYGPAFTDILRTYTSLTGRPGLLPRWAFGLMLTSYPQGHQDGVADQVEEHRKRRLPLDAVILDYHWEEGFHNFRWRESLIPDPDGLIRRLSSTGIRLGLILTPFLNRTCRPFQKFFLNSLASNLPPGREHDDERVTPEYREALGKGLFAHPNARWWFGRGGMMDFTFREAAAWWNAKLKPLYDRGVAFFKNDDGEYLPLTAKSSSGLSGREYHNLYGFYYGRAMYEGMAELDDRRPFIYGRSVWAGSQRFPAMFLGDQKPTFENILRTMRAGLNLGLLGFAYWTADVFGLDGKTTPETHMRYAQWALLSPVARYFQRPAAIDDTRFPWSHGPEQERNFRLYSELRYRLLPLYHMLGLEAHETGLPLLRPLLLHYRDDARFAGVADQVLLGDALMLCPVLEPGAVSRRILVPEGEWYDFWTESSWKGPSEIDYPAPPDRLPILVKGGRFLPMGPVLQFIPDGHRFDTLEFHLRPPYAAEYLFLDDDGTTRAYERGERSEFRLAAACSDGRITLRAYPEKGGYSGRPAVRKLEFVLHRAKKPSRVDLDGLEYSGWSFEGDALRIPFTYNCGTGAVVELSQDLSRT